MAKATKKIVKKVTKKTTPVVTMTEPMMTPTPVLTRKQKSLSSKALSLSLVVVVVGLLTYKVGPWLVPAIVDNSPVSRLEMYSRLEKSYGAQVLDDMVNEKILDRAIADAHVTIDPAKVEEQLKMLETQFESTGGLDEALKQRGLTRKDLEKQVRTQLSVEVLLADKITPTEEEVKAQFEAGAATMYKDKKLDEVKPSITEELKQTKLRDAFLVWFAEVKKNTKVKTFGL